MPKSRKQSVFKMDAPQNKTIKIKLEPANDVYRIVPSLTPSVCTSAEMPEANGNAVAYSAGWRISDSTDVVKV
jgi:hypothetical protein